MPAPTPPTRAPLLRRIGVAAALLLAAAGCGVGGAGTGRVAVRGAWARPSAGPNAAAYLTLFNGSGAVVTVVGARTPAAARASLHESMTEQAGAHSTALMVPLAQVSIAPGDSAAFAPGGRHVMLEGLRAPLAEGGRVPLALVTADGGEIRAELVVRR